MKSTAWLFLAASIAGCGGRVPQTQACRAYVACVAALDEKRGTKTNVTRFDADGDCWGGTSGSELCSGACVNGLAFLRSRQGMSDAAACTTGGTP